MRALVTGASGLLGSYLLRGAPKSNLDVFGTYNTRGSEDLAPLDITDRASVVRQVSGIAPNVIIHCAGEGRVDYAEEHPYEAHKVNVEGTKNLLWAAKHYGLYFVYISTNAVFGGDKAPYGDHAPRDPINAYGRIKRDAEDAVLSSGLPHLIIRPIMLYGWPEKGARPNFVTRVLEDLGAKCYVTAAENVISQPTYAYDAAYIIWKLVQAKKTGEINIAPRNKMSLWEFAQKIALTWEHDPKLVQPVKAEEFKNLAPRPLNTTFSLNGLSQMGLYIPETPDGLKRMKKEKE